MQLSHFGGLCLRISIILQKQPPTVFLDAVEAGFGKAIQILSLFRSDEGIMHPTEYLSNLFVMGIRDVSA